MRTSVTLDEDVYQMARLYAKSRALTLGGAIGEIVRKVAVASPPSTLSSNLVEAPNGLLFFASQGRTITPEMVKQYQEDEIA